MRDTVRYTSLLDSGVISLTLDQVRGFVHGQDKVDLKSIAGDPTVTGNQACSCGNNRAGAKPTIECGLSG